MTEDTKNKLIRALIGAGIGGSLGKAKNGNKGMLAGALTGGTAGVLSPDIISALKQTPIGSALANINIPSYTHTPSNNEVNVRPPHSILQDIVDGKPIHIANNSRLAKQYELRKDDIQKMFSKATGSLDHTKGNDDVIIKNNDGSYLFYPQHMQGKPIYDDIVNDLKNYLAKNNS